MIKDIRGVIFEHASYSVVAMVCTISVNRIIDGKREGKQSYQIGSSFDGIEVSMLDRDGKILETKRVEPQQVIDLLPINRNWNWDLFLMAVEGFAAGYDLGYKERTSETL
jgi:hypothetical protein